MKKFTKPHLSGENNGRWKGGRLIRKDGYIFIYKPDHLAADHNGYVMEHRLVMSEKLGRLLERHEVVHHLNHDKGDNRPENLVLINQSQHIKEHIHEMMKDRRRASNGTWLPK